MSPVSRKTALQQRVRLVALMAPIAMLGVACTSDEAVQAGADAPTSTSAHVGDEAPTGLFDSSDPMSFVASAGLGDDLALVQFESKSDKSRTAVAAYARSADGVWTDLPTPPLVGDFDLASAGDTVIAGGLECVSDSCTEYRPRFLHLSTDRTRWIESETDLPEVKVDHDTDDVSVRGSRQPMAHAVFVVTAGAAYHQYAVDSSGLVQDVEFGADAMSDGAFLCRTDDIDVMLHGEVARSSDDLVAPAGVRLTGTVDLRRLGEPEQGFVPAAAVPDVVVDAGSLICGYRSLTLHAGANSYTYDLDTDGWTEVISNYREVNRGITVATPTGGQIAMPDGTVFEGGRRRAPDGTWSTIPGDPHLVATNGTTVYAITGNAVTTFQR